SAWIQRGSISSWKISGLPARHRGWSGINKKGTFILLPIPPCVHPFCGIVRLLKIRQEDECSLWRRGDIMDDRDFFQGRRVFITGHTGFKGSWLSLWLLQRGAIISGYSLGVPTSPSLFETLGLITEIQHFSGDIRDAEYLTKILQSEQPEIIFHLAA